MIKFDKLFITMKEKGVSTYVLREKCGIDSKTVRRLKANENIETKTLDKLCLALDCKIEDIVEFVKDQIKLLKNSQKSIVKINSLCYHTILENN